jgi:hypothetical protein
MMMTTFIEEIIGDLGDKRAINTERERLANAIARAEAGDRGTRS